MSEISLTQRRCLPCEGGVPALDPATAEQMHAKLHARWTLVDDQRLIAQIEFDDYAHTTSFVNAVAWVAQRENHHPEITFGYRNVTVQYWTHAVSGLTENDFICAAKIDALLTD